MRGRLPFLLAGAFLILSPVSLSSELGDSDFAKYLRLAVTALIVLVGIVNGSFFRAKAATWSFMPFVALWSVSPLWSSSPAWGLFYRSMFVLTFLSGVVLATSPQSLSKLESGLRLLGTVSCIAAIVVLYEYISNPTESVVQGRMAVGGINANTLGQTAAPLAVLCAYLALYGRRGSPRFIPIGAFSLLCMILILTGSRGGIMMAMIGCGILAIPLGRRPGLLILAMGVLFGCAFVSLELINAAEDVRAIEEMTKDTRSAVWKRAMEVFLEAPIMGRGWLTQAGASRWATVQNAYIQVLAEAGIVGFALFCGGIAALIPRVIKSRRVCRYSPRVKQLWYLCVAFLGACLFHGLVESSLVVGTVVTPLLFGFGLGLVDRIPMLARVESDSRSSAAQIRWVWVPDSARPAIAGVPAFDAAGMPSASHRTTPHAGDV